jgi:hypothetical protein
MAAAGRAQLAAVDGLWGQLIPMTLLFFCMAFVNTLLDAVKVRSSRRRQNINSRCAAPHSRCAPPRRAGRPLTRLSLP